MLTKNVRLTNSRQWFAVLAFILTLLACIGVFIEISFYPKNPPIYALVSLLVVFILTDRLINAIAARGRDVESKRARDDPNFAKQQVALLKDAMDNLPHLIIPKTGTMRFPSPPYSG